MPLEVLAFKLFVMLTMKILIYLFKLHVLNSIHNLIIISNDF